MLTDCEHLEICFVQNSIFDNLPFYHRIMNLIGWELLAAKRENIKFL